MSNIALSGGPGVKRIDPLTVAAKIVSGLMLLAVFALLGIYMQARSEPGVWPPKDVQFNNYVSVMVTLTLLMSFMTAAWARSAGRKGEVSNVVFALFSTAGLGVAALNLMALLVSHFGFGPSDSQYAVLVYAIFLVVGANFAVALGILTMVGFRSTARQTTGVAIDRLRAVSTYGQASVLGWILVYATIYVFK
jgi:heme/copper-type cytochrome/quinol oxidase subunit 3